MKHRLFFLSVLAVTSLMFSVTCLTSNAEARAGSGSSMGSRGSRS